MKNYFILYKNSLSQRHFILYYIYYLCYLSFKKTDLKIKNIVFCTTACVNDYKLILTLNEYILHSGSAVLLKHKGSAATRGEHLPFARRAPTCKEAAKDLRMSERKREERDKLERKKENTIRDKDAEGQGDDSVATSKVESLKWLLLSIADIGNHIMNLIGRTISSLALPDKRKGSCSLWMEENHRGSSSEHDDAFAKFRRHR